MYRCLGTRLLARRRLRSVIMKPFRQKLLATALCLGVFTGFVGYYFWFDPAWKLAGLSVPIHGLERRGFPLRTTASEYLAVRQRALRVAAEGRDENLTSYSLNADIVARGKFQKMQVQDYCLRNQLSLSLPTYPVNLYTLYHHLIYDDSRRLVFCYVPKNGCSNLKRMMLILNGLLPPSSANDTRPDESVLSQVHSFEHLSASEAHYRLENYYKVVVVRNPKDRIVSAYRNKIETPFDVRNRAVFPEDLKQHIFQMYERERFHQWLQYDQVSDIHPSFSSYIRWLSEYPYPLYNEHFKRVTEMCFPCAVDYDLYINFKTYDYDIYALMDYLEIPTSYYPRVLAHSGHPTSEFVGEYFRQLSCKEKELLRELLKVELDFYYSLYPEERGRDTQL